MEIINDIDDLTYELLTQWMNEYTGGDSYITGSDTGVSPRKIILKKRYMDKAKVKASSLVKMFVGGLVHEAYAQRAKATHPEYIVEQRYHADVAGVSISAQPDILIPRSDYDAGVVEVADKSLKTSNFGTVLWDETDMYHYRWQVQAEKLILSKNEPPIEVVDASIDYLFTNWTDYQYEKGKGRKYPSGYDFPMATESYPVGLMDNEDIEEILTAQIQELQHYESVPEKDIPDCSPVDTGEKPPWAVYELRKDGKPRANCVMGGRFNFKNEAEDLQKRIEKANPKKGYVTIYSPTLDRPRCRSCFVNEFCNTYKAFLEKRDKEQGGA